MKSLLLSMGTFTLLCLSFFDMNAQIPNGGFENWTNMGAYNNPVGWQTLNDYTAEVSVFTCTKGTPGNPGASFIKLTSKAFNATIFKGIAVAGQLDVVTATPFLGVPFADRPEKLSGKWQHMIVGSSQGYIDIFLTRWDASLNARVPVATKHQQLSGMALSWSNFEIPLVYTDDGTPDSCMIVLSASGTNPTDGDYLWVDDLAFQGSVEVENIPTTCTKVIGFPNPASSSVSFMLNGLNNEVVRMMISSQMGALVRNEGLRIENGLIKVNIEEFAPGAYIFQFFYGDKKELVKIVVE